MKIKIAKTALAIIMLLAGYLGFGQKIIQEKAFTTAPLSSNGKGVAAATVDLEYKVWADLKNNKLLVYYSYTNIRVDAAAGYYYNGKLYRSEVPGLVETLGQLKLSVPRVSFDLFYGSSRQSGFTREMLIRDELSPLMAMNPYELETTKDKLENPAWRLVGVSLISYSNTDYYKIEALIEKYERERKEDEDYSRLIREADGFLNGREFDKALSSYREAARLKKNEAYPQQQVEKIKLLAKKEAAENNFTKLMDAGSRAERGKDFSSALSQFEMAATLGVDDSRANRFADDMRRKIEDVKREKQEELEKRKKDQEEKDRQAVEKISREKEEAEKAIRDKQEEIERKNEEEAEALKKQMDEEQRRKLDQQVKEKQEQEAAARKQAEIEEKNRREKERLEKKQQADRLISKFEQGMQYDPVKFQALVQKADSFYHAGCAINPYEALELKAAWWDNNYYMTDFREDLNEPRRREAWQKAQQLQHKVQMEFDIARYTYMEAIRYADRDSYEHRYLLKRIEWMDALVEAQSDAITQFKLEEEMRQMNFEQGRVYARLNRLNDNRVRSEIAYQYMVSDYLYPYVGKEGENSENALERRADFERRLNEADQQLAQDNLVTGVTSQLALNAITDDSKEAKEFGNHSMGLNLFVSTGYASYPVISNMTVKSGYIPESRTGALVVAPFQAGFDWWIHRSNHFDIGLTGDGTIGVLPIRGYKNFFLGTHGSLKINAGVRAIKLALEASWEHRQGSYQYDQDVALSDPNNPWQVPTEQVYTADISYNVRKLGAGLHISFAKDKRDGYLRLMYYAEQPSFYQGFNWMKPVWSGLGEVVFRGGVTLRFAYSKNYPMAGDAQYMMRTYTDRDYWRFSFGKTWTIGKTK